MTASKDNRFIYGLKFIACLLVITLHAPFPGVFGEIIAVIARFAVPFFFAVSGRFLLSDGGTGTVTETGAIRKKVSGSLLKLLKVTGIVYVIYLVFSLAVHFYYRYSFKDWLLEKFNLHEARDFFLFNSGRFIYDWSYVFDHMWYLFALIYVYGLIYLFAPVLRSWYKALIAILLGFLFFGELLRTYYPIRPFGISISTWYVLRNWLFVGIPFVLTGICFGDYAAKKKGEIGEEKARAFFEDKKVFALAVFALGVLVSFVEYRLFGAREVYLGSVVIVCALLFLSESTLSGSFIFSDIGKRASANIYFFHVLVIAVLDQLSQNGIIPLNLGLWKPLIVMALCILFFYVFPFAVPGKRHARGNRTR